MIYLFWLIILGVVAWAVLTYLPMEGNLKKILTIAFVIVGVVLLLGLIFSIVPFLGLGHATSFPIK